MLDVFRGFDRNNNGMLEFDELSGAAEDSSDPTLIISLLSEGDADGKGFIDYREFADIYIKNTIPGDGRE